MKQAYMKRGKRIAELEADVLELKALLIKRERFYNERLDLKKAERDKLREALQEIADDDFKGKAAHIAWVALEEK